MNKQQGFTLIELMIAVAIVAIIAAVALPAYQEQAQRGRLSECNSFAYTLASQLETYYTRNNTYPGALVDGGLDLDDNLSESGACEAAIRPSGGGSCAVGDAAQRCVGYTLTLTLVGADEEFECRQITLDHRGQKSVVSTSAVDAELINECWH